MDAKTKIMKAQINNYLSGVDRSERFNKQVAKLIPNGVDEVKLWSLSFDRLMGWGHYSIKVEMYIDNDPVTVTKTTTDSTAFDLYKGLEYTSRPFQNFVKRAVLAVLEHNQDELPEIVADLKRKRLEELREELRNETISYGELIELQRLVPFMDSDDVELLEAAGVPERVIES